MRVPWAGRCFMLSCSQCGQPIPPDATAEGMAFCPHCKHVFPLQITGAASPLSTAAVAAGRGRLQPPTAVRVQADADGVALTLPWRLDSTTPGGPLLSLLLATAPIVPLGMIAVSEAEAPWSVLGIAAYGLLMGYIWAVTYANSTVVYLDAQGVEVLHGPVPTAQRSARLSWQQSGKLYVDMVVHSSRYGGRRRSYNLVTTDGKTVISGWRRRDALEYLLAEIAVQRAVYVAAPPAR